MSDSGKKRKRALDVATKPSKKVSKSSPSVAPVVPDISVSLTPEVDSWAPIVVSTPGLAVATSISLQPYTRSRQEGSRHGGGSRISKHELLLQSSQHQMLDYVGQEEEAGGTDSLLKHYIGVYDPKTGNLQLMEARKMAVRGVVRSQQAAPEALLERGVTTNMRELRNDLGQTFGTKKARKAIASITENAISPQKAAKIMADGTASSKLDSVTAAMLASMANATESIATRDELQLSVDDAKPRPKANLTAQNVNDVYTVESLIGLDVMKSVPARDWQDSIKEKMEIISMSKYVAHRIQKSALDVQKLKTLRYLESLLLFLHACKARRGVRSVPKKDDLRNALPSIPDTVVESIRRKFTTGNEMSKFQQDFLITHVCALALLVDNFEVDVYDLREDLNLEAKVIQQYFHEVGAKVTNISAAEGQRLGLDKATIAQRKIAKLKLPLEFPKQRFMRKK